MATFLALPVACADTNASAASNVTAAQYAEAREVLDRAWERTRTVYYSPKTHLYYVSPVDRVVPARVFEDGFLDPDKGKLGYGSGMGDCTIFGGVLLSMLADRYEVTTDKALATLAHDAFEGLKLCATVHGVPGFVARGVCIEDGKSICITSSRDQVTHFVHGLWRYYHCALCDEATKAEIRTLMEQVADRMIRNVTPDNDYDFLRADGSRDPRGICRMWNVRPHEAARLPMVYAAAWDICRKETYFRLYREVVEPAVDQSLTLPSLPQAEINAWMPTYTLLQMQTSLELLYELETDEELKAKIARAMEPVAQMGAKRAIRINGGEEKYLCACGEAALAQLMAAEVVFPVRQVELLLKSITDSDVEKISACRTIHLLAAFWRARRAGILKPPSGGASATAANPSLFFGKDDIPTLQTRLEDPQIAPAWQRVLQAAEACCDPESARYADLEAPFKLRAQGDREPDHRYRAVQVHDIGRSLTEKMEALGFAYQMTGRREWGDHGAAFLARMAELYPVTNESVCKGFAGGRGDVMRGLALGYDWLSECLEPRERRQVAQVCADYIEFFLREFEDPKQWFHKVHNYNGVNGGSAGCLALAIKDQFPDRYEHWVSEAVRIIERWLDTGFDQQGAYVEGVGYTGYGLSNTILFAHALRRCGSRDPLKHPVFGRLDEFLALSLLPGESVYDARNDSNYRGLGVYLLGLAQAENGGLYRWLWETTGSKYGFERVVLDNQIRSVHPAAAGVPTAQHFEGRGLCVWRTGWTENDVMFSMEAGPYYPVTHNQGDKGHFTLYGLGQRWATDPGYANEHAAMGRGQTPGHSCVLIDEKGQALSGAGWGTDGEIKVYENSARCGYALADCTDAYNRNNKGIKGVGVDHALRHAFFVYPTDYAPAYAVVLDDILKNEAEHEYAWQMMLADDMNVALHDSRAEVTPPLASGGAYIHTPWTDEADAKRSVEPDAKTRGQCVLQLSIREAGEYTIWARVRSAGADVPKSDSFFVRVDDGEEIAWHMPGSRDWTWGKVTSGVPHTAVTFTLKAGKHQLTVKRREPGAQMDCLWVTAAPEADGTDPGVRKNGTFMEAEAGRLTTPMAVHVETDAPRMVVHLDAVSPLRMIRDDFIPNDHHAVRPFPRLRGLTTAVAPEFMAVLLPLPGGTPQPKVMFERNGTARIIRVQWQQKTDIITWPRDGRKPTVSPQ